MKEIKDSQAELEQYRRKLGIRIDGVPMAEKETSNNVFQNVKLIIEEPSSEYLMLQSMTEPTKLIKDTLIKRLR